MVNPITSIISYCKTLLTDISQRLSNKQKISVESHQDGIKIQAPFKIFLAAFSILSITFLLNKLLTKRPTTKSTDRKPDTKSQPPMDNKAVETKSASPQDPVAMRAKHSPLKPLITNREIFVPKDKKEHRRSVSFNLPSSPDTLSSVHSDEPGSSPHEPQQRLQPDTPSTPNDIYRGKSEQDYGGSPLRNTPDSPDEISSFQYTPGP
jgi:hypothetical protein